MELSVKALRCVDSWLQRFVWMAQIMIVLCIGIAAYYIADRQPPFAVLEVQPAEARPGETVTIVAHVWRDRDRNCSVAFSRYLFDAKRVRFDLSPDGQPRTFYASDGAIDQLEATTPGLLKLSFVVPNGMAPGPAVLQSELRYACNQMHRLWPIEITTVMPFKVLP